MRAIMNKMFLLILFLSCSAGCNFISHRHLSSDSHAARLKPLGPLILIDCEAYVMEWTNAHCAGISNAYISPAESESIFASISDYFADKARRSAPMRSRLDHSVADSFADETRIPPYKMLRFEIHPSTSGMMPDGREFNISGSIKFVMKEISEQKIPSPDSFIDNDSKAVFMKMNALFDCDFRGTLFTWGGINDLAEKIEINGHERILRFSINEKIEIEEIHDILKTEVVAVETAVTNNCFTNGNTFPPSRYIGFYDEYLGFQNGSLPKTNQIFSGTWTYSYNGILLLEGQYTNGIPIGIWKEYSDNNTIRRQCEYKENNSFTETVFWLNGAPRLKITGTCFWQPKNVRREIHSITRMDGSKQIGKFPEKRIAVCHYFKNNEYEGLNLDKFHEAYMMFYDNEFRFHSFQRSWNSSEWKYDFSDGTVDWENKTLQLQNPSLDFPYKMEMNKGNVQCISLSTPWGSFTSFDKPKGNAVWSPTDINSGNDSERPFMYITERHWLTDLEFTNAETGDSEKIPFQVVLSGFYMPGSGWSDVMLESAGMPYYTIDFPSLFDKFESHFSPDINKYPLPSGVALFYNYWGGNSDQLKKPHDSFNHEVSIVYDIFANFSVNLPDKNLQNIETGRSFKPEVKVISFDKYRDRLSPQF
jgi:Uncharacterized protein conserved in bacteria